MGLKQGHQADENAFKEAIIDKSGVLRGLDEEALRNLRKKENEDAYKKLVKKENEYACKMITEWRQLRDQGLVSGYMPTDTFTWIGEFAEKIYARHANNPKNVSSLIYKFQGLAIIVGEDAAAAVFGAAAKAMKDRPPPTQERPAAAAGVTYEGIVKEVANASKFFGTLVKAGEVVANDTEKVYVQAKLLHQLYVVEPPCRSTYGSARIITTRPASAALQQGSENLLFLPARGQAVHYVNDDKNAGQRGVDKFVLKPETTKVLRQSLKLWPREYVLSQGTPLSNPQFWTLFTKVFTVGIRMWRWVHATDWYDKNPAGILFGEENHPAEVEYARRMRHSVATARALYRKVDGVLPALSAEDAEEGEM